MIKTHLNRLNQLECLVRFPVLVISLSNKHFHYSPIVHQLTNLIRATKQGMNLRQHSIASRERLRQRDNWTDGVCMSAYSSPVRGVVPHRFHSVKDGHHDITLVVPLEVEEVGRASKPQVHTRQP